MAIQNPLPSGENAKKLYFFIVILASIVFLSVLYQSHHLRPSGDDYCYGAITAEYGLFGGVIEWWNTWSAFLFAMFSSSVFIGLPLAFFPFDIASSITFLLAGLGMGLTAWAIFYTVSPSKLFPLAAIPFLAFCWWTFIWAHPALNSDLHNSFANGVTFWQTLNGQYVIPLQIILIGLALTWPREGGGRHPILMLAIAALLGILVGTAGTALSITLMVVGGLLTLWTFFKRKNYNHALFYWVIFCSFILISAIACHFFSPGSVLREQAIRPSYDLSVERLLLIAKVTFVGGFKIWIKAYFNVGSIVCLALTTGFFNLYSKYRQLAYSKTVLKVGSCLGLLALLQCFINRLSEEFTYQGYWHFLDASVCIFLSLIFFGSWLGAYIIRFQQLVIYRVAVTVLFSAAILIGIQANHFMTKRMQWRGEEWVRGSAVINGVSDIGSSGGFEIKCWNKLNSLRPHPIARGQYQ